MTKIDVASLRREYRDLSLDEEDVRSHPADQFQEWFEQAVKAEAKDPSGMTLVTADSAGQPSGRVVLLKGFDRDRFVFYSNYGSRKAREIEENPKVAMVFWWTELDRQVRIQGTASKTSAEDSQAYFATRPRGSQISAIISPQSRVVESRRALEEAVSQANDEYAENDVPCPANWGGFRVSPTYFEFWQGRPNRLHDRICYRLESDGDWLIERLAP